MSQGCVFETRHCHSGAAQRSPESITAKCADKGVTLIDETLNVVFMDSGLTFDAPE